MNELISIIIPVYNVEKYLSLCLESVINQTYQNLEVIIVDDGSTDHSGMICDEYAKKDNRIKVIHQENGGLSDARNKGLMNAHGEYVAFVDSDDKLNLKMYETLYRLSQKLDSDLVFCELQRFSEDEPISFIEHIDEKMEKILTKEEAYQEILFNNNVGNYVMPKMYHKKVLEGIEFPQGRTYEDIAVMYKIIHKAKRIASTNEKLYYYLVGRTNAITSSYTRKKILDSLQSYYEQYLFLTSHYESLVNSVSLIFAKMYTSVMEKICMNEYDEMFELPEIKDRYPLFKKTFDRLTIDEMKEKLEPYRIISMMILNNGIEAYKGLFKTLYTLK